MSNELCQDPVATLIDQSNSKMSETKTARQFWISAPGRGEIVRAELPPRRQR